MISKKSAIKTYRSFATRTPEIKPNESTPNYTVYISEMAEELLNDREIMLATQVDRRARD